METPWALPTIIALIMVPMLSVAEVEVATEQHNRSGSTLETVLNTAAEVNLTEIALGKLAIERAADEQVKKLAAKITVDHKRTKEEVQELAASEGVSLTTSVSELHLKTIHRLSNLVGTKFDAAYLSALLEDHESYVRALESDAQEISSSGVASWAATTLPLLRVHMEEARHIGSSLGMSLTLSQ